MVLILTCVFFVSSLATTDKLSAREEEESAETFLPAFFVLEERTPRECWEGHGSRSVSVAHAASFGRSCAVWEGGGGLA